MKKMILEDHAITGWALAGSVAFATVIFAVSIPLLLGCALVLPPMARVPDPKQDAKNAGEAQASKGAA